MSGFAEEDEMRKLPLMASIIALFDAEAMKDEGPF